MSLDPLPSWQPGLRPRTTFIQRVDYLARRVLPIAAAFFLIVILSAPTGLPGATALLPGMVLSFVFFWSIWRPDSMPAPAVFLLGLFLDLVGFAPPGVNAMLLLIVHGVAYHARFGLMRLSFLLVWLIFAFVAVCACTLNWALVSAMGLHLMPTAPGVFESLLAIGIYPLLSALFSWAHRTVADPDRGGA